MRRLQTEMFVKTAAAKPQVSGESATNEPEVLRKITVKESAGRIQC